MTWFTKLSANVKSAIVLAPLLLAGVVAYRVSISKAEQRGRDSERTKAAETMAGYVALVNPLLARKDSIEIRVDTLRLRATASAKAVTAAVADVPMSVRDAEPTVDIALDKCVELAADVERLTAAQMTERTAWREIRIVDSTMISAQAVMLVAKNDTIATLNKRPRWRTVVKVAATTGAVGVAVGKYLLKSKAGQ